MHPDDWPEWKNGLRYPDWKWQEDLDNQIAREEERAYYEAEEMAYYAEQESIYYEEQERWCLLGELITLLRIRMEDLNDD